MLAPGSAAAVGVDTLAGGNRYELTGEYESVCTCCSDCTFPRVAEVGVVTLGDAVPDVAVDFDSPPPACGLQPSTLPTARTTPSLGAGVGVERAGSAAVATAGCFGAGPWLGPCDMRDTAGTAGAAEPSAADRSGDGIGPSTFMSWSSSFGGTEVGCRCTADEAEPDANPAWLAAGR